MNVLQVLGFNNPVDIQKNNIQEKKSCDENAFSKLLDKNIDNKDPKEKVATKETSVSKNQLQGEKIKNDKKEIDDKDDKIDNIKDEIFSGLDEIRNELYALLNSAKIVELEDENMDIDFDFIEDKIRSLVDTLNLAKSLDLGAEGITANSLNEIANIVDNLEKEIFNIEYGYDDAINKRSTGQVENIKNNLSEIDELFMDIISKNNEVENNEGESNDEKLDFALKKDGLIQEENDISAKEQNFAINNIDKNNKNIEDTVIDKVRIEPKDQIKKDIKFDDFNNNEGDMQEGIIEKPEFELTDMDDYGGDDLDLNTNKYEDTNPKSIINNEFSIEENSNILNRNETNIDKNDIIKQIVDKANILLKEDKSVVRIKLKPEILGELVLKVEVENGKVVAKALVDNYKTKEILETNVYQLKEGLEEKGLDIKTFEINVGIDENYDKERNSDFNFDQRRDRPKFRNTSIKADDKYVENILYEDINPYKDDLILDIKA